MVLVYLCLGSNVNHRKISLDRAIVLLSQYVKILKKSTVHETEPQYEENQPLFLNQVIAGETDLSPHDLLKKAKGIEKQLGRTSTRRYGPRIIDIDILYYGKHIIREADLVIPHPSIPERKFVLEPLFEIDPDLICPIIQKTVSQMLHACP